ASSSPSSSSARRRGAAGGGGGGRVSGRSPGEELRPVRRIPRLPQRGRMLVRLAILVLVLLAPFSAGTAPPALATVLKEAQGPVTRPEASLGFSVGADRIKADYGQIVRYFETLDRESPRLELQKLGKTTLGRDLVMAVISSERNLQEVALRRGAAAMTADPRQLTDASERGVVEGAPVVVLVTCNIHSSEIGSSQMAMEWAYRLCTSQDPKVLRWL